MNASHESGPTVLLVSEDDFLVELLTTLLAQEGIASAQAAAPKHLRRVAQQGAQPKVVLVDAIEHHSFARDALATILDAWTMDRSTVLLLRGSVTPAEIVRHPRVDRFILAPMNSEELVKVLRDATGCTPVTPESGDADDHRLHGRSVQS